MARKNGIDIQVKLPTDRELAKMFDAIPQLKRHGVLGATTQAGAKVIVSRAKQLAPRGNDADRQKRSAKQKAAANWNIRLHTTIAEVTRRGNRLAFSIVGPRHPQGNKAYFNSPKSGRRRHVLWGKAGGERSKLSIRNWIVQAFDETRSSQLSAMKAALTKKIHEMMS
jgi:hypothetical protein